jgi:hypothetical protein
MMVYAAVLQEWWLWFAIGVALFCAMIVLFTR